jgi:Na+/melibiose symporter-like transporter
MMPDVADYCELRNGIRADAFLASMGTLGLKIGNAWGPAFVGFGLSVIGYVGGVALDANGVMWMNYMFALCPGIISLVAMVIMTTYKINMKEHTAIREKLVEKYALPLKERDEFRFDIKDLK